MVPTSPPETQINQAAVALFRREDLVRIHTLLMTYESPFTTPAEAEHRAWDEAEHERLRKYIASLLLDENVPEHV